MRRLCCIAIIFSIMPAAAWAGYTMNYVGETSAIGSYTGLHADAGLWDYVYEVTINDESSSFGPRWWAIGAATGDLSVFDLPTGWNYYSGTLITGMNGTNPLYGREGIRFEAAPAYAENGTTYTFHFQSSASPILREYDGGFNSGWQNPGDTTWSNPEPGSMALVATALFSGLWLRRRRAT